MFLSPKYWKIKYGGGCYQLCKRSHSFLGSYLAILLIYIGQMGIPNPLMTWGQAAGPVTHLTVFTAQSVCTYGVRFQGAGCSIAAAICTFLEKNMGSGWWAHTRQRLMEHRCHTLSGFKNVKPGSWTKTCLMVSFICKNAVSVKCSQTDWVAHLRKKSVTLECPSWDIKA